LRAGFIPARSQQAIADIFLLEWLNLGLRNCRFSPAKLFYLQRQAGTGKRAEVKRGPMERLCAARQDRVSNNNGSTFNFCRNPATGAIPLRACLKPDLLRHENASILFVKLLPVIVGFLYQNIGRSSKLISSLFVPA
jgi:hypothetical protein